MGTEIKRKLASIERIEEIRSIEGADAIEAARVLGWWVVVKKQEYKVGDLAVYIAIDSWVPHELAPFLSKGKEPREYEGVKGERVRTVKLRGAVSQGLLLPIDRLNDQPFICGWFLEDGIGTMLMVSEGQDVTEALGIQKWEAPVPAQLAGVARGTFPTSLIHKTDQERIQNCFEDIQARDGKCLTKKVWNAELEVLEEHDGILSDDFERPTYEKTLKLDGSSMTVFRLEGEIRVCSRNMELKINEENAGNSFVAKALEISDKIPEGYAIQGELIGEGIQGNPEKITGREFYVFDVFDIPSYTYLLPEDRRGFVDTIGLKHVPVIEEAAFAPDSVDAGLEDADGPSLNAKLREGVVYKSNEGSFSFKCISTAWLLKNDG